MKILLVCDYIREIGGVANYTRPLFYELLKQNADVTYLFTSSQRHNYSFKKRAGIVKLEERIFEYQNCPILVGNYNRIMDDISFPVVEKEVEKFLVKGRFDVVHIHSLLGYPASIYKIFRSHTKKLYTTVHEYWWLCPYRVMVDFNNRICNGPEDFNKCAFCTSQKPKTKERKNQIFVYKMKQDFPHLTKGLVSLKQLIKKINSPVSAVEMDLSFGDMVVPENYAPKRSKMLEQRLNAAIEGLNLCDKVIAVSNDTKKILCNYGVQTDKVIVQHIGSVIAEQVIEHTKTIDKNKMSIGFIGGVGYYKGVHQLVDAFVRLPQELKNKSELHIYGGYTQLYYDAIMHQILTEEKDRKKVYFHGRFTREEVPSITNTIDFSVLPSLCADTAPQTIFESFNAGLPIIAPRVGGFGDFVIDGENGLLYKAASVEDLSKKMAYLLDNIDLIPVMKKNIAKTKTMSENVKELLLLYREK